MAKRRQEKAGASRDYLARALEYASLGYHVFPCMPARKEPLHGTRGFKDATTNRERIRAWWTDEPAANIGLAPGPSGLVVIDVDGVEGEATLRSILGPEIIQTREATTARGRHLYFKHPGGTIGNRSLGAKLDVRADAGYVIAPPSQHPSGARYSWANDLDPGPLPQVIERLLTKERFGDGERNQSVFSRLCGLRAKGAEKEELEQAAEDLNGQCDPPLEPRELGKIVTSVLKYPVSFRIETRRGVVKDLNEHYAVVQVGGKVRMLQETEIDLNLLRKEDFLALHANRFVPALDSGRLQAAGDAWFKDPERRQYTRLVFEPGELRTLGAFNLWRGWGVQPKKGDCTLYLAHLKDNICDGNEVLYEWVLAWLAQIFQQPTRKPGTAVVLRGKQGTGKTVLGLILGRLLGSSYALVAISDRVSGKFNAHLEKVLLLQADEAFWAGDHSAAAALKDLITSDIGWLEKKGIDAIPMPNHMRLLVTSNAEWVVPSGLEERRFCVIDVADHHMQDHPYFEALTTQMETGGYEALLYYLLYEVDTSRVNLRAVPMTAALVDQKHASLTPEQGWWLDVLKGGILPGDVEGTGDTQTASVYDHYIRHATKTGVHRRSIETRLGTFLTKNVPGLQRSRRVVNDNTGAYAPFYCFPPLKECRDAFSRALRHDEVWGEPEDWQEDPFARRGSGDNGYSQDYPDEV